MSTTQHKKSVLLALLGTLAFTLSTLPEVVSRMDQSSIDRQPAEVSGGDCSLEDLDKDGKVVDCEFTGRSRGSKNEYSAKVTIKRTTRAATFTKKFVGENKSEKAEADDVFEITVEGQAQCEKCNMDVRTDMARRVMKVTQLNDVQKLRNFIESEAKRKIEEARTLANEERQRREAQDRCDEDTSGEKLRGRERMECKANRIAEMDDKKAAYYFHDHMKGELLSMLQSSNAEDRMAASEILNNLSRETNNTAIKQSVSDMVSYANVTMAQNAKLAEINSLPFNDPRRYTLAQQLYAQRRQADAYFRSRTDFLNGSQQYQMTDSWLQSMTPALSQDITSYQRDIDARYNAIIDRLRVTMDNSTNLVDPMDRQFNPGGRTVRGQPLSPGQYPTTPSSGNVMTTTPFGPVNGPAYNNNQPAFMNSSGRGIIPQAGQPVTPQQLNNRARAR